MMRTFCGTLLVLHLFFSVSSTSSSEVTHDAISRVAARFAAGANERVEVKLVKGYVTESPECYGCVAEINAFSYNYSSLLVLFYLGEWITRLTKMWINNQI